MKRPAVFWALLGNFLFPIKQKTLREDAVCVATSVRANLKFAGLHALSRKRNKRYALRFGAKGSRATLCSKYRRSVSTIANDRLHLRDRFPNDSAP